VLKVLQITFVVALFFWWLQYNYRLRKFLNLLNKGAWTEVESLANPLIGKSFSYARLGMQPTVWGKPLPYSGIGLVALRSRALARLSAARIKEARNDVALALEWSPNDPRANLLFAMCEWKTRPQQAIEALERAERGTWRWETKLRGVLSYFRALANIELGNGSVALDLLQPEKGGMNPLKARHLGHAFALNGECPKAIEHFKLAGDSNPWFYLATFLFAKERYEEALFWTSRSMMEQPTAHAMQLKAAILSQLNRQSEAQKSFENWATVMMRPRDFHMWPGLTSFGMSHLLRQPDNRKLCLN
jgi:tetratricopeptide (TPR) repeat protein